MVLGKGPKVWGWRFHEGSAGPSETPGGDKKQGDSRSRDMGCETGLNALGGEILNCSGA